MRGQGQSAALRPTAAASIVAGMLLLSACTGAAEGRITTAASPSPSASASPRLTAAVTAPAIRADDVLTSTEVAISTDGTVKTVQLTAKDGTKLGGMLRPDGRTWVPAKQLAYDTTYTVKATAAKGDTTTTATSTFTTMRRPGLLNGADPYVFDGDTVGVGMPIAIELTRAVPKSSRAAIERRLFVQSTPAVEGSWYWWSDSEVHYRPKHYWTPGTKVSLRVAIGGLPMGNGTYGKRDRVVRFQVGDEVVTKVDSAAHVARVYQHGKLVRTMPASLGRASMPTSSGTMVVMDKQPEMTFDSGTFGVPVNSAGGYRQKVKWDVRFTWGGEFFHSAPWSVGDQGRRNVSHGCINLSPANAQWFYDFVKKGDVVEIVNTGDQVEPGDGWTDWNVPWRDYVKGSALYGK
jgi:lipoprotein-anchoring transpeptidase ErfK/SrfK